MKIPSLGTALLYGAAAFQATQFARAFHAIDMTSRYSDVGGVIAGIVVNVSLAYSANRLPRVRAKKAQRFSYAAFIALLVLTPLLLAPINYKTMGSLWSEVPGVKLLLAVISASLVDIAISLVAFSDRALLSESASQSERSATESPKSPSGVRRSAKKSAKSATDSATQSVEVRRTYPRKCDHCEMEIVSPNAVGGHMKKHHPDLCKAKPLAVKLFEGEKV